MPYQEFCQDNFSKGELSPYMYARAQLNQYYTGLKQAQNVLLYPTGAAGKRFGTLYQATLAYITQFNQFYFDTFQYLDQCIYQIIITPLNIAIYLEGIIVANVVAAFNTSNVYTLTTTTIGSTFRITGQGFAPLDLKRTPNSPDNITAYTSTTIAIAGTSFGAVGAVLPVKFDVSGGTIFTSVPQVIAGVVYFTNATSSSIATIYLTPEDAKFKRNAITTIAVGSGTSTVTVLNTWTLAATYFKNLPIYDFNGTITSYDALTFTPSATTGTGVTITVSGAGYAPLNSSYVGGAFIGAGGTSRITAVASATSFTVSVENPFDSTSAIQGSLSLLAEPAWSNLRGWPQVCSSYQNRALFANTPSLPNGFYASVVNDYSDFGDLTTDDDDAISWYPSSNAVNVIRFIVPFRSITVHTNSGVYSSPLSDIAAITPTNFTLQLQDSTPASVVQPQAIDNQIIVLSGNDAHTMIWDGINNAYTSNIVSVANEQVINTPLDEAVYADLTHAGSRYVFMINEIGSMAMYQTLQSENVSGFTPIIMEQSYGEALFRQCASSSNGRAWFVVERDILSSQSPINITAFTSTTLTAIASSFDTSFPTPITFTTSGTLPTSIPQLAVQTYYWAIGVSTDTFQVYLTQEDALALVNPITFSSFGVNSHVVSWISTVIFTLEELTHEVKLDCAIQYTGTPTDTITTGNLFNGMSVKMIGDGFGFNAIGVNNQVAFESHGESVEVSEAFIGFPINYKVEPMPISQPVGQQTTLTKPTHIRTVRFMFNNTIGGTINGVPIALKPFNQAEIGEPPLPARGIFEMGLMRGWNDSDYPSFVIEHDDPFDIQLLGIFYSVET